jgi:hypothetical protein
VRRMLRLALVGTLVASSTMAHGALSCLEQCDLSRKPQTDCCLVEPCFADPCGDFLGCRAVALEALNTCIAENGKCQPTSPGRCTIILGCVYRCERQFQRDVKVCERDAFGSASLAACGCGDSISPKDRRRLSRACLRCGSGSVTTTSTSSTTSTSTPGASTTTTSTSTTTVATSPIQMSFIVAGARVEPPTDESDLDSCARSCLRRMNSVRSCYKGCAGACNGNSRAIDLCREGCRNFLCKSIKGRCSNRDVTTADQEYLDCCTARGTCLGPEEAPCIITSTTTTTTSTSTSTVVTTSSTTTSTSPPF